MNLWRIDYLISEAISLKDKVVIIPTGEKLYHGTGVSFDVRKVGTGGYDSILWTTNNPIVSRYYIPSTHGATMFVQLERSIIHQFLNKEDPWYSIVTKQLGISPSMAKVLLDKASKINNAWVRLYNLNDEHRRRYKILEKEVDLVYKSGDEKRMDKIDEEMDGVLKDWNRTEDVLRKFKSIDNFYYLGKAIAQRLEKLYHYKLTKGDTSYDKMFFAEDGSLLPANHKIKGKLIVLVPKRNLKLYNHAHGIEGDLMDVQYHDHDVFRSVESKGYDGIVINDFAQSDVHGNVGHISYGLFRSTIKDCKIMSLQKQTHPDI